MTDTRIPDILEKASSLIRQVGWSQNEIIRYESSEDKRERDGLSRWVSEGRDIIGYSLPIAIEDATPKLGLSTELETQYTALAMGHAVAYAKFGAGINEALELNTNSHGTLNYRGVADFRKLLESQFADSWIEMFTNPLDDFERILVDGVRRELFRANQLSEDEYDVREILAVAAEKARRASFDNDLKWYSHLPRAE